MAGKPSFAAQQKIAGQVFRTNSPLAEAIVKALRSGGHVMPSPAWIRSVTGQDLNTGPSRGPYSSRNLVDATGHPFYVPGSGAGYSRIRTGAGGLMAKRTGGRRLY